MSDQDESFGCPRCGTQRKREPGVSWSVISQDCKTTEEICKDCFDKMCSRYLALLGEPPSAA